MIVNKDFYFYDITCDRCGNSLAKWIYDTRESNKERRHHALKRDCFSSDFLSAIWKMTSASNQHICKIVYGWRYNRQNRTFVCGDCGLILTTKKGGKE